MGMAADAKMIGAWAMTLVTETELLPADVALFLGFEGTLERKGNQIEVTPAPMGTSRVTLNLSGDDFAALDAEVTSPITTKELEPFLGPSKIQGAGRVCYRVTKAGAPHACAVECSVDGGRVKRVTMTRA